MIERDGGRTKSMMIAAGAPTAQRCVYDQVSDTTLLSRLIFATAAAR